MALNIISFFFFFPFSLSCQRSIKWNAILVFRHPMIMMMMMKFLSATHFSWFCLFFLLNLNDLCRILFALKYFLSSPLYLFFVLSAWYVSPEVSEFYMKLVEFFVESFKNGEKKSRPHVGSVCYSDGKFFRFYK